MSAECETHVLNTDLRSLRMRPLVPVSSDRLASCDSSSKLVGSRERLSAIVASQSGVGGILNGIALRKKSVECQEYKRILLAILGQEIRLTVYTRASGWKPGW